MRLTLVPNSPAFVPSASPKSRHSRVVTVVLPLVPVTPTSFSFSAGWPNQLADMAARAALPSLARMPGPSSQTTAAAPSARAWAMYLCPSVLYPRKATKTSPGFIVLVS